MGIEKHTKVTGVSEISWKDAINKTVEEFSQTTNYLNSLKILEKKKKTTINKITQYYVDLEIGYLVEQSNS